MGMAAMRIYEFGPFRLDPVQGILLRDGEPVRVTLKAFEILLTLVEKSGHVVRKQDLITQVWPNDFVEEANLTQHIFMLRKALGDHRDGRGYIETIPRRGYRFMATVRIAEVSGLEGGSPAGDEAYKEKNVNEFREIEVNSLAVLPLIDASSEAYTEYLSDGITESLINALSQLPQLRVMALSTVSSYKSKKVDIMEVGKALNVQAVLTGKVSHLGDNLIISVEMVDMADGSQIWGRQYNRKMSDVFQVQDYVSQEILKDIRRWLSVFLPLWK
jgi:DNA-binding winged helix-turn-helix (wHTH) protein